ncbi:MAG TPA: ATP-binding protein [Marmoricola sp.]|nr:ATP-binding protein [Marmoricola sp.]
MEREDQTGLIQEVLAEAWSRTALQDALQQIAEGVTEVAGFGVAAVSVLRETDEFEVVAVAGSDDCRETLLGNFTPLSDIEAELAVAEDWGRLRFVPHERLPEGVALGWVPDQAPLEVENAWHPLDLLVAPLLDDDGRWRGLLAVDLPDDGMRPDEARRRTLELYAVQAGRALASAVERQRLVEQVRLASAARTIVRKASARLNFDQIVQECQQAILDGFGAQGMWIRTFDQTGDPHGWIYTVEGGDATMDDEVVRIANDAAERCWREQVVGLVSRRRAIRPELSPEDTRAVLDYIDGLGMASLLFVPLGAGTEVLGNIVIARSPGQPEWTDVETDAALDIGHDLGRALLNARLFEREERIVEELRQLDGYKSRLIATISHELKNPLTAIQGHLEMLDDSDVQPSVRHALEAIGRSTSRLSRTVEDLLVLSRVENPSLPLDRAPVDLQKAVEACLDGLAFQAAHKQLTVSVRVPPDDAVVALGDARELEVVFANLLSNAIKYTPAGRSIGVALSPAGGEVVVDVCDEGIGISEEDRAGLFGEFFRTSNPVALEQPGTGLGLAIVRRIVERHGGSIEVQTALGEGSTFRVRLPSA